MFVELGKCSQNMLSEAFWTPNNYSFVAVRRILRSMFAKQKFAQLTNSYIRRILPAMFANKSWTGFTCFTNHAADRETDTLKASAMSHCCKADIIPRTSTHLQFSKSKLAAAQPRSITKHQQLHRSILYRSIFYRSILYRFPSCRYELQQRSVYWAVQWSWFARVNALCNLSRKKSREVASSLPGRFLSRCITMEVI